MRLKVLFTFLLAALALSTTARAQVRINEVGYGDVDFQSAIKWVELHNTGSADVDVSTFWLCNFPNYSLIVSLRVLDGNTTIPAGGFLVVAFDGLGVADGEVALYRSNDFDNVTEILDYVQYGSAGHQRASLAATANLWDAGAFSAAVGSGKTLSFFGGGANSGENWGAGEPTPGVENTAVATAINAFDEVVETFRLTSAFPNPFNPSTQFTVTVAQAQHVVIEVYSLLGRRIDVLHDGMLAAQQRHRFTFEAGNIPSGLYLIRVGSEQFSATQRVTLLK